MPDHRHYTEADAVVAEARALEEETKTYTLAFQAAEQRPREAEADPGPYRDLLEAARRVVEASYGLQDPLRDDPYKTLGAEIIGPAEAVLEVIEDFGDDIFSPPSIGRLGEAGGSYEALLSAAERLVALCYQVQNPLSNSPYAPLGEQIADPVMEIYQTVKTFTPPAPTADKP